MRIQTRFFLCFVLAVSFGFYYLVDWIQEDLRPRYLEAIEESLVDTATILSSLMSADIEEGKIDAGRIRASFDEAGRRRFAAPIYDYVKTRVDLRVYVTDAAGIVIFDSDGGRDEGVDYSSWNDVLRTLRGEYGARSSRNDPDDPDSAVLYVASPLLVDGEIAGVLSVCKPTASANLFLDVAKGKIVLAGTVAGLGVILLGLLTSAWVTHPIRKLTDYAKAVSDGRRATLPRLGRSEIGVMGETLEEMRDALEGKEYVEKYIQTLTHEIKGPLSAIRGAVELLQEEGMTTERRERFLQNSLVEAERIQHVVDRLLLLSSLESRKGLREVEEFDLRHVVEGAARSLAPVLESRRLNLETVNREPVTVRGERFLVRHAVVNLLQNAIDFSPSGGKIRLTCEMSGERAVFTVTDEGPGVPDFARDRVFDRFYSLARPESGRKSSGLGLTFAQEVADLHGGDLTLENIIGGGARAVLRLAAASHDQAG